MSFRARKSAAATSRFVRPSATSAATRCSAAVSTPLGPHAASDLTQLLGARLFAQPTAPSASKRVTAESIASCWLFLPRPAPDDAECEEGARATERIVNRVVLRDGSLERNQRLDVAPGGGDEPTTTSDVRQHPGSSDAHRVLLPAVQQHNSVICSVELEERLDRVGPPPAQVRLAPLRRVGALFEDRRAWAAH